MSNKKKTENILPENDNSPINLKGENSEKEKVKKYAPHLEKEVFYNEIKDIYKDPVSNKDAASSNQSGIYIRTKENKKYRLISNFLKIVVAGFVILLLINSVNVYRKGVETKKNIQYKTYEGYDKLLEGSKSTTKIQFQEAKTEFENALKSFEEAQTSLWFILNDNTVYAKQSTLSGSAKAVLESGKHFALAGQYFTESLEELNKIPVYFISKNETNTNLTIPSLTDILKNGLNKASQALIEVNLAKDELNKIGIEIVPQDVKGKFLFAKEKLNELTDLLNSMQNDFPAILKLLGDEKLHRYLILLQNNSEIRPSGGFIGSYIILDISKGMIENMRVEDVYHLDDKYQGLTEPPEYLLPIISNWKFRDSNYSPDFMFSGKQAAKMFEKEGGGTVDTVIAVNQSLLKDFLQITGPLQVGALPNKIIADNYDVILSYIIESKVWGKEDPKHVLKVMVPEFKKELIKSANISKIMSVLYKAAQQKLILGYSSDAMIQSFFDTLGISGRIKAGIDNDNDNEDYLSVVNYSIGGNKTEPFIEEKIAHNTEIQDDGSLIDEVTVTRTHLFNKDVQNKWNKIWDSFGFDHRTMPGFVVDILGRGTNVVYTRILVPQGSSLKEVIGVDEKSVKVSYDKELNKTYFAFKISVPPQNTSSITLKYTLPFKLNFSPVDTYKLTVQKQPGSTGSVLTKTIQPLEADSSIKPYVYYPDDARQNDKNKIIYATNLVYDRYFSAVFGK